MRRGADFGFVDGDDASITDTCFRSSDQRDVVRMRGVLPLSTFVIVACFAASRL